MAQFHFEPAALDVKRFGLQLVIVQAAALARAQYELFAAIKLVVMNPILAAPALGDIFDFAAHKNNLETA